jgi:hypothetical protein
MLWVAQCSAQWSGNLKALNVAMAKMSGVEEFCTREPHFEGEEVFGSQKRKVDIPFGSEHESHRPDRVNFSYPRVRTRSTRAGGINCSLNDIPKELSLDQLEDEGRPDAPTEHSIPIRNCKVPHITAIQETACKETE